MTVFAFAFWLFAIAAVVAGLMVVVSRNPVHSVLWLVLAFFSGAGLFVLLGAEFVAMLMVIVYVGAVMVLFLFVVMMLDIDFETLKGELARYAPLGLLISVIMLLQLGMAFGAWEPGEGTAALRMSPTPEGVTNTVALGELLYDRYLYLFQAAGLILLVAMIGAILLTMRHRKDVKRQDALTQIYRKPGEQMSLKNVKPGQGL